MGNAKRDHILIWGGSLLIGAALCLLVWNMMNEHRAARSAQQALKGLTATEAVSYTHLTLPTILLV